MVSKPRVSQSSAFVLINVPVNGDMRRISVRHEHVTQLLRTTGLDSAANQMLYIYIYIGVSRKAYANKLLKFHAENDD